jgi:hypothetical protein
MSPEAKEAALKQRALECRAIRLHIAQNPGLTLGQLKKEFKEMKKLKERLDYLVLSEMVRTETSFAFNGNVDHYYVVRK